MVRMLKKNIALLIIYSITLQGTHIGHNLSLPCRQVRPSVWSHKPLRASYPLLSTLRPVASGNARKVDDLHERNLSRNPYGPEKNINRGFTDLNYLYFSDIREQLARIISDSPNRKVRILLVGAGRGFEAFELMYKYGDIVDITSTGKEDLVYKNPKDLVVRLNEYDMYEGVDEKTAEDYIRRLREQYFQCDLNKGINVTDNTFDMVIVDTFTLGYVEEKYFAMQEMLRVCKPGGVMYCTPLWGYVEVGKERFSFGEYFNDMRFSEIKNLDGNHGNWLRFTKTPSLILPELVKVKSGSRELIGKQRALVWDTYYVPITTVTKLPLTTKVKKIENIRLDGLSMPLAIASAA